jgi:hypothetical protein
MFPPSNDDNSCSSIYPHSMHVSARQHAHVLTMDVRQVLSRTEKMRSKLKK